MREQSRRLSRLERSDVNPEARTEAEQIIGILGLAATWLDLAEMRDPEIRAAEIRECRLLAERLKTEPHPRAEAIEMFPDQVLAGFAIYARIQLQDA